MRTISCKNRIINLLLGSKNKDVEVNFEVENQAFKIVSPDDQYWGSIKDVLLIREYEYLTEFELQNFKGLVVDAGAHVGLFSIVASRFARKIVSIEPNSKNYCLLYKNCETNKINNILPLNKVLCENEGTVKLYKGVDSGCSSIVKGLNTQFNYSQGVTLQRIIEEFGDIDLLKLDVEGAEFGIFQNIEINHLKRINAIVAEIHLNAGKPEVILKKLRSSGFTTSVFYPPVIKKIGVSTIHVQKLAKLKWFSLLFYELTRLLGLKEKNFQILFAIRKDD